MRQNYSFNVTIADWAIAVSRLWFPYTPKHGGWLNRVEFPVLSRQCLNRRISKFDQLSRAVASWKAQRKAIQATGRWLFTVDDARTKPARLYSQLSLP